MTTHTPTCALKDSHHGDCDSLTGDAPRPGDMNSEEFRVARNANIDSALLKPAFRVGTIVFCAGNNDCDHDAGVCGAKAPEPQQWLNDEVDENRECPGCGHRWWHHGVADGCTAGNYYCDCPILPIRAWAAPLGHVAVEDPANPRDNFVCAADAEPWPCSTFRAQDTP